MAHPGSISVLLVEDDDDSRELLGELLSTEFEVHTAADAEEGLRLFLRERPQVVVTDHSLPGMSGTELAEKVKEAEAGARVVLFTGHSWVPGAEVCDLVLQKPVDPQRLLDELAAVSRPRAADVITSPPAGGSGP
jgi:DNA-binding NtrC family response regulator